MLACRMLLTGALLLVPVGCDADSGTPSETGSRPVPAAGPRVVSLDPLATRFVVAIGASERLVAIDPVSARLPGLDGLPTVSGDDLEALAPDLILTGDAGPSAAGKRGAGAGGGGARRVHFAPRHLEQLSGAIRELGAALVGEQAANRYESALLRPLAFVAGESRGARRPRAVAVTSLDPLEIAGGHSFESDLIEIAGGMSVTHAEGHHHGVDDHRRHVHAGEWRTLAPDLVLVARGAADEAGLDALRAGLPAARVLVFDFPAPDFWLEDAVAPARRLRALIEDALNAAE